MVTKEAAAGLKLGRGPRRAPRDRRRSLPASLFQQRSLLLLAAAVLFAACGGDSPAPGDAIEVRYEFRATSRGFEVRSADQEFEPFYTAGINFGLAIPGTLPGEFLATPEQIARWIAASA